eukprot:5574414-Prymnesium_polylepis.4
MCADMRGVRSRAVLAGRSARTDVAGSILRVGAGTASAAAHGWRRVAPAVSEVLSALAGGPAAPWTFLLCGGTARSHL